MIKFFNIDEPCVYRAMGNYLKDGIKQQYLFRGHDDEVFWFEIKKVLGEDG